MKKIFSSIILSALVIGMFLKPVSVYAYSTDLNSYIDPDLSVEDAKEYVAQTILAYALAAGAEMVVPGSGATVAEITDKVWDVIDFTDELYEWALYAKRNMENGYLPWEYVDYNLSPGPGSYNAPIMLAWDRLEKNWNNNEDNINPNPDTNYLTYLELINGSSLNFTYLQTDNWLTLLFNKEHLSAEYFTKDPKNYSYINTQYCSLNKFNSSNYTSDYICYMYSNKYRTHQLYTTDILSLYINQVGNSYQVTTSSIVPEKIFSFRDNEGYIFQLEYTPNNNFYELVSWGYQTTPPTIPIYSFSGTLEECFKSISMNFRNVNIYVDGVPWSIVSGPPDPIELGGNTYITNTNTPVYYDFPDGTLFDPNAFAAIMHQLIDLNNTGNAITIQLDDILESFTDEYGHTAQYVVNIVRNDYDNLISEQYGNRQVRVQFPEELKQYSEEITYIMNNFGDDLIPQDLLTIICCGGILLLIGFLINRMLE